MKLWMIALICAGFMIQASCGSGASPQADAGEKTAKLTFASFDGGGPSYSCELGDPSLVSVTSEHQYYSEDHDRIEGAGYEVLFTFTGLKPGETELTVRSFSPIVEAQEWRYRVSVDDRLAVTLTELPPEAFLHIRPRAELVMEAGGRRFYTVLEPGPAAEALLTALNSGAAELEVKAVAGSAITAELPWELPADGERVEGCPGDMLLTGSRELTLCGEDAEREGVLLASFNELPGELFADGIASIGLWLEWGE